MRLANLYFSIGVIILSLLFLGISENSNRTGFIGTMDTVKPISRSYSGKVPDIYIEHPNEAIVIVYSHGNGNPTKHEDCNAWWNDVPNSLLDLQKISNIYIYYLCSLATDEHFKPGYWIFDRVIEVENTLDQLILAGVSPENIFLSGHSSGAWSSLMSMENVGLKFNAAIIFAPACCGPRYERHPIWRGRVRPLHIHKMLNMNSIEALIFAYFDDPYNRPQDLNFLKESYLDTIKIVGYNCGEKHLTHIKDCKMGETRDKILNYIESRQKQ